MKGCDFYKRFWQHVICPILNQGQEEIFLNTLKFYNHKNANVATTMAKLLTMATEIRFLLIH